jgi:hypothetical protein
LTDAVHRTAGRLEGRVRRVTLDGRTAFERP